MPAGDAQILDQSEGSIRIAANRCGGGRSVYLAGLPYSAQNSRLLHRALYWAAGAEEQWDSVIASSNPRVEVALYPEASRAFAYNNTDEPVETTLSGGGRGDAVTITLGAGEGRWLDW